MKTISSRHFHQRLFAAGIVLLMLFTMNQASAVSLVDARAPLNFEANRGQAADWVNFISRGRECTLLLGATEAVLGLRGATVRLQLVNANPGAAVSGVGRMWG